MARAVFILVTAFWLTMNIMLWQTQFGSRNNGGAVPVETVWEKILTAADDSSLTVFQKKKLAGACHLHTAVGDELSKIGDENMPSGAPERNRGYDLSLDGSVVLPHWTNRLRFEGELKLDKNREWQKVSARVTMRPITWELQSVAAQQNVHLKIHSAGDATDLVLQFSDLKNPAALSYKLLGPAAAELLAEAGLQTTAPQAKAAASGVKWDAHEDILRIGRTGVQVYRLHTRLLERYEVNVLVSRAGEILRVDLPEDVTLINDRLAGADETKRHPSTSGIKDPRPPAPEPND